jgi:2-dehydro-3-deoxyglucarate aldolase/4-hydroxy-2-oxoheptanedioate aldolase
MRENPVKQKLQDGGHAFGAMIFEFFSPGMAQIARAAGAEFILFDMEHSGITIETVKAQIAACRGLGIVPGVRVPATQYHFISSCLDAGAMCVMVPMVETVEQARDIVRFAHYPPHGVRGSAFGVAGAAAAADAIAAVPGVDVLWLGHFDLTNFMGIPAQFDNPQYLAAMRAIVEATRRHGKTAGFMATDEAWARDYLGHGFRMMAYGLDSTLYQTALARGLGTMRDAVATAPIAVHARTGGRKAAG